MVFSIRQLFRARDAAPAPAVPRGERVYAVGDIHGRLDLLSALMTAIEADNAARGHAETTIVLLGDLVDRGPHSAGVLKAAQYWQRHRRVRIIAGNHEEMLLDSLTNVETLRHFLRHGGQETVLSFGVDPQAYAEASYEQLQALMARAIPVGELGYIRSFEDQIRIGDYLFVHAGIRPGVPLEAQKRSDLRWIREPFLSATDNHGAVIIHGHTITESAVMLPNRIGLDTGAYASGRLTAMGIEGTERWLIETAQDDGATVTTAVVASLTHAGPKQTGRKFTGPAATA